MIERVVALTLGVPPGEATHQHPKARAWRAPRLRQARCG